MGLRAAMIIAGGLLLAGCVTRHTPAPVATNFPTSHQAKLQASAHWQVISDHMARELRTSLKTAPRRALYVQALQTSSFTQAAETHLITALVNDGFVVVKTPEPGALRVELETQVVAFSKNRPQYRYTGEPSILASGAWVLTGIEHSTTWLATTAIYAADAYHWFHSLFAPGPTPKAELIVTVSVADQQRYYARTTSVYYTSDEDRALYDAAFQPGHKFVLKDR